MSRYSLEISPKKTSKSGKKPAVTPEAKQRRSTKKSQPGSLQVDPRSTDDSTANQYSSKLTQHMNKIEDYFKKNQEFYESEF